MFDLEYDLLLYDVTTVQEVVAKMEERFGLAGRIWVMDRGMVSRENLEGIEMRTVRTCPLRAETWRSLHENGHDAAHADLLHGGRRLRLEVRGFPFGGVTDFERAGIFSPTAWTTFRPPAAPGWRSPPRLV